MSTLEVARFLKRLSTLYRDPTTGNPRLSDALAEVAAALNAHPDMPIRAALAGLEATYKQSEIFPEADRLRDLSLHQVVKILSDDTWTKVDLVRLGAERFAISRSRLERVSKAEVAEAIRSALRNEESLKIISQQAERGGTSRSS